MLYDYVCRKCNSIFTINKSILDPHPDICIICNKKKCIERFYSPDSIPSVIYAGRPVWTYNDVLKYKECSFHDGPMIPVDKNKHGDITAFYDGPLPPKKGRKNKK